MIQFSAFTGIFSRSALFIIEEKRIFLNFKNLEIMAKFGSISINFYFNLLKI
jgi:hypothetical protein